jgi:hypothetical protein
MRLLHKAAPSEVVKGALAGALAGVGSSWLLEKLMSRGREPGDPSKDPKVKVARGVVGDAIVERVGPRGVGRAVHYATGMGAAAAYGALAEVAPAATFGWGALFGVAVWATLPQATLPAMGLAPPPWEREVKEQAKNLGYHVVYGVATEALRRPLRATMGRRAGAAA